MVDVCQHVIEQLHDLFHRGFQCHRKFFICSRKGNQTETINIEYSRRANVSIIAHSREREKLTKLGGKDRLIVGRLLSESHHVVNILWSRQLNTFALFISPEILAIK